MNIRLSYLYENYLIKSPFKPLVAEAKKLFLRINTKTR